MRFSISFAVLAFAGCAATRVSSPDLDAFRFEGKPIHPAIINEFIPWQSDGEPVVAAVDLKGFTRSQNRLCRWTVKEENGWVRGDREPMCGYLEYRFLGVTSDGAHVIEVHDSGGGSASWRYLVRLRYEEVTAFGSRRLLLRCENVEELQCCPVKWVDGSVQFVPHQNHRRELPESEPSEVDSTGPTLADPFLLRAWFPRSRANEAILGRLKVFPHSVFFSRIGLVEFDQISAHGEITLLRLKRDVDSSRFLRLAPEKSEDSEREDVALSVSLHATEEAALQSASPLGGTYYLED